MRSICTLTLVLSLAPAWTQVCAETTVETELHRVNSANRVLAELATARLALEEFNLERMKELHAKSHASWVELSRQELLVGSLREQFAALV